MALSPKALGGKRDSLTQKDAKESASKSSEKYGQIRKILDGKIPDFLKALQPPQKVVISNLYWAETNRESDFASYLLPILEEKLQKAGVILLERKRLNEVIKELVRSYESDLFSSEQSRRF